MATTLPLEFQEFLNLLNLRGVEYLVVGGFAVICHGHPRTTGDLDIWIATSPQNVDRVRQVLREFGFSSEAAASAPLDAPGKVIRMGRPPLRIELLTSVSGLVFDACHQRRVTQTWGTVHISFLSRVDLIANKRVAGRSQDIADIEALEKMPKLDAADP